jgi:di/tricarboxylate transporter
MAVIGRRLLPDRSPAERYAWNEPFQPNLSEVYGLNERLYEAQIAPVSGLCDTTIAESRIGEALGLSILAIVRNGHSLLAPQPSERLRAGDILLILGRGERVERLAEMGVKIDPETIRGNGLSSETVGLVEVVIAPRSRAVGQTLKQLHFRQKFGLNVIAVWHAGRSYRTDVGDVELRLGDAMLMFGRRDRIRLLQSEPDFIVLRPELPEAQRPRKGPIAALIMLAVLVVAAFGWLPIGEATFAGAMLMVLTGCLSMDEAYQSIEWRAVFLIAGMLPLGVALAKTGAGAFLGQILIQTLGGFGPIALLAGIYLLAMLMTQFVSGQAAAVIITPIAISAAAQIGVDARAFAMGAALACSTAFLTPIAHPVNLLAMGPAGYTSRDFVKVGLPLTAVCFIALLIVLPLFWPL